MRAVPIGKIADGDIADRPGSKSGHGDTEYDNELLDAHYTAGDGRANENIGLTARPHVFHSEHNRLVEHTKEDRAGRRTKRSRLPQRVARCRCGARSPRHPALKRPRWSGTASGCSRRPVLAPRCSTSTSCSRSSPARSSRNINAFLVPDGFDTTMDPSIVADSAHVVYRFGHSMLTESIDRFDPTFNQDHIGLIQGFLNPLPFDGGRSSRPADHRRRRCRARSSAA